jgi:NAD(P)H-flavin reductase
MEAPPFVPVPVLEAWDETPALRGLRVDLGPLRDLHRVPGQVVKLRTPSGAEGYFALASAPSESGRAELLIKRGGAVADEAVATARVGAPVEVTAPFGRGFPIDEARGRDVLLFAAGSGITPIRALVQHLTETGSARSAKLFYGERAPSEFAYAAEHAAWEAAGVHVVLCVSRPTEQWVGARGYVQAVAQAHGFEGLALDETAAYLCGPKPMIEGVKKTLAAAGLAAERAYLNY